MPSFVSGYLFTRFGAAGVTGLNLYSLILTTLGAVVVLFIYDALNELQTEITRARDRRPDRNQAHSRA